MSGTGGLMAVIDLMGSDTFTRKDLAEGARELFVKAVLAVECHDLEGIDEEMLSGLAACSRLEKVEGSECADLFENSMVEAFRAELPQYDEEAAREAVAFPTLNWSHVRAPKAWVIRVGRTVGRNDAMNAKALSKAMQEAQSHAS